MVNIPTFATQPGAVGSAPGGAQIDIGAQTAPLGAAARAGAALENVGDRFAQQYINAKMEVAAADQTADLSQKLAEVQNKASKIPDREQAGAFYDAESQKLYDGWKGQFNNPLVAAHVESRFKGERVLRRTDALNTSFQLESQTQRGKLITQLDQYSKTAADATDPRLRQKLIEDGINAIDGRVKGGWMNPEAGAKAKVDFESGVYRSMIEQTFAKNPRLGMAMYDQYKGKLNFQDGHQVGVMSEDKRVELSAEALVNARLPVLGSYGSASKWAPHIEGGAAKAGLPSSLVGAVADVESGGNEGAVSPAGARGPMQFMPATAKDEGVANPHDPGEAIGKGAGYLKKQIDRFGSVEAGLAAYNWGPENVDKWQKAGSDFSKLPKETQDYVREVQKRAKVYEGTAKSGDALATYRTEALKAEQEILADTTMDPRLKQRALAFLQQRSRTTEGLVVSQRKQIDDTAETLAFGLFNGTYKDGGFAATAQAYRDTGDNSKAAVYDWLAQNEGLLKDYASLPPGAQRTFAHILPGAAGKIAASILADGRTDRKELREYAGQQHTLFQKGVQDGLDPVALAGNAREAAMAYVAAGDTLKAKQVVETYQGVVEGARKGQLPTMQAEEELRRLKEIAESQNGLDAKTAAALGVLEKGVEKNREAWKNDPLKAAEPMVGRLDPWQPGMSGADLQLWVNKRVQQAQQAQAFKDPRATVQSVPLVTQTEADMWKAGLMKGSTQDRQTQIAGFAAGVPENQIPLVAKKLAAGNDDMADVFAISMAFYKKATRNDPAARQIADSLIVGANRWLEGGPEGKLNITLDAPTLDAINSEVGTARAKMDGRDRDMQNNAIAARYVYLMQGKPVDKHNDAVLRQATRDIVGNPAKINGADTLMPTGVEKYQFQDALTGLTQADLPALQPVENVAVSVDKIRRYATFQPVGDGIYKVWMPDPKLGGQHEVRLANGLPWELDMRPYIARTIGPAGGERMDRNLMRNEGAQ